MRGIAPKWEGVSVHTDMGRHTPAFAEDSSRVTHESWRLAISDCFPEVSALTDSTPCASVSRSRWSWAKPLSTYMWRLGSGSEGWRTQPVSTLLGPELQRGGGAYTYIVFAPRGAKIYTYTLQTGFVGIEPPEAEKCRITVLAPGALAGLEHVTRGRGGNCRSLERSSPKQAPGSTLTKGATTRHTWCTKELPSGAIPLN